MRIATLNYHNAYNYGAVFQAQALQNIVEQLGHDCEILDYRNEEVDKQYKLCKLKFNSKLLYCLKSNLVLLPFLNKKKKNFQHWFENYKKTHEVKKNELQRVGDRFDKLIVGSDQVWNMKCHGADTAYFLDFVDNKKKIAYAASFGTYDIPPRDSTLMEKYIPTFSYISVREARGIDLVEQYANVSPVCTMDPVLLIGKEYWEEKASKANIKAKYIFVYQLGHDKKIPAFVKKLKRETGYKVVFITGHIGNIVRYSVGDMNYSSASPEDFLSFLINAEYIVTNSFHATVLAILFHKRFSVVVEGDATATYNSRIYNILKDYQLEDRIVQKYYNGCFCKCLDYTIFDKQIDTNRKKSIEFLKKSIGE